MAKGKTTYERIPATFKYAKVFEHNKDMGREGSDVDYSDIGGQYQIVAVTTEETKDRLVEMGIPEVSMGYKQFKPAEDGMFEYRFKRPHINKWLKDDNGERVVMGPPQVIDLPASQAKMEQEGGTKLWEHLVEWPEDTLIGNGSSGFIKFQLYKNGKKAIVTLESVAVQEHVPFEANDDGTPAF